MDFCPKVFVVDYGDILNRCLLTFMEDYANDFTREDGLVSTRYVYSGKMSRRKLRDAFEFYVRDTIEDFRDYVWRQFRGFRTKTILVAGTCNPAENAFPNDSPPLATRQFFLTEPDIDVGLGVLEPIWDAIFREQFAGKAPPIGDVVFFRNRHLNSSQVKQLVFSIFQQSMYAREFDPGRRILVDVNDRTTFSRVKDLDQRARQRIRYLVREVKFHLERLLLHREPEDILLP